MNPFLALVLETLDWLTGEYNLVIVEGAGSALDINLQTRDNANMGFAMPAGVPVVLVGDISKGGVIAALAGTKVVLHPNDATMIVGFIVNKFHGDVLLFDDGVTAIQDHTLWPCLGVIPWICATSKLPAEDAASIVQSQDSSNIEDNNDKDDANDCNTNGGK
jgi:adenosylcobyric acid synthase